MSSRHLSSEKVIGLACDSPPCILIPFVPFLEFMCGGESIVLDPRFELGGGDFLHQNTRFVSTTSTALVGEINVTVGTLPRMRQTIAKAVS